jgi:hypothetical protein
MTRLKCKRVPCSPDSPDLVTADLYVFDVLKQALQSIDVRDDKQLKSQILAILYGIPSDELEKSFDHWIKRCQSVTGNPRNDYLSSP